MQKRTLEITAEQRQELEEIRDHHATAYLRERAAALLKIAGSMSVHAIAQGGLLRTHKPDTVYSWLNTFQEQGIAGLSQHPRRGKKYSANDVKSLQEQLHQSPRSFGWLTSRWTLQTIRQTCDWLNTYSLSGVWRVLRANGIRYKRGQEHLHSPDPDYVAKRDHILWCVQQAREHPGIVVVLFLDEFSYYRWPSTAQVYSEVGVRQPRANLTPSYNTQGRLVVALDVLQGKVL